MSPSLYLPLLHLILLISSSYSTNAQSSDDAIVNVTSSWINNPSSCPEEKFNTNRVRLIYSHPVNDQDYSAHFTFAFFCDGKCSSFLLAILLDYNNTESKPPVLIWSANRNKLVRENSTLEFTREGDLILKDVDGSFVWSTNTSGRSVTGLKFTDFGNLVLIDTNNSLVWQSYDHPTDTLVLGQKLVEGQKLIASVSAYNWREGLYSLFVTSNGIFSFFASDPPLSYSETRISGHKTSKEPSYAKLMNGSFALYILNAEPNKPDKVISVPQSSSVQYVTLDSDGYLSVLDFGDISSQYDLLTVSYEGGCGYPLTCGKYGICSSYYRCTCPPVTADGVAYFKPVKDHTPYLGCYEITPLSCEDPQSHLLLNLQDVTYFNLGNATNITDYDSCRHACLSDCSCKVAFFRRPKNDVGGDCFMHSEVFTLVNYSSYSKNISYNVHAFIKVQSLPAGRAPSPSSQPLAGIIDDLPKGKDSIRTGSSTFTVVASLAALITLIIVAYVAMKKNNVIEEDDCLDHIQGTPSRFSYNDLKAATGNFHKILGEGAFGCVYEGVLTNGVTVAVKRLNALGNVKMSFLSEVETIGSIHHMNLVKLIGFSADKSHSLLLVYEYMCNGSLDKWIFCRKTGETLDWKTRKNIIIDIAKGLTYLHEECQNRILHLDIKPQNILLDSKFNAKVSDFGLSKLINREQSRVMTIMRGTPGYMAPEWLNSMITEKVDVFSFGVVVLEMLCGRKTLDFTQPEEYIQLLQLLEKKANEDRRQDMIDKNCEDMQLHSEEVVEMMKVAEWCLQSKYSERPSMSMVVKVIEGLIDIKLNLNYNFSSTLPLSTITEGLAVSTPLLPSILSGPR